MKRNNIRPKRLTKYELKSIKRKELIGHLLPLAKSFGVWIVAVTFVAWDYTSFRWFSMFFVHLTTYFSYAISKLFLIPVKLLGSNTDIITTLKVNYDIIIISNYLMKIELECSAYHAYIAAITLVAFSAWKRNDKLFFGGLFVVILAILNSFRIVMLGVIGQKFPAFFNVVHDYIWNILLVIILWGFWEFLNNRLTKIS